MWPLAIVTDAPRFDNLSGFWQTAKPFLIQTLGAKASIERLNLSILRWLAWLDELQLYLVFVSPQIDNLASELAAVIDANHFRHAVYLFHSLQNAHHAHAVQAGISVLRQTLARKSVGQVQGAKAAPIAQTVVNEVHAPSLVGCRHWR